jgi:hypothetical protein
MLKAPSSGFLIGCPERGTAKAASLPPMPLLCSMVQNLRTDNGQRCCRLDSKCFIPARLPQLQLVIASLSNALLRTVSLSRQTPSTSAHPPVLFELHYA